MIDILREHAFFRSLPPEKLAFVAGCGRNVLFKEGEIIASLGDEADTFYLIREGRVAVSLEPFSGKPFVFQTLARDDILGLSWLIPPYRWTVEARAVQTTHAIALDGGCLRKKCEEDALLGYLLMKQLVQELVIRENAARLHLLDIYGRP